MKNTIWFWILILPLTTLAQSGPKQYWIQFTDKANTPYALITPLEFLSQRALDRRAAQGISLSENDLPVDPAYIQAVLDEGASYLTHSKWFNSVSVHIPDSAILDSVMQLPFVVNSESEGKTNRLAQKEDKLDLNTEGKAMTSSQFSEQDYGLAFNQIDMLGGVSLHDAGYMGQGMLIAVLDAGFFNVDVLSIFDSLRNDGRLVSTWDFVEHNNSVYADHQHGMMVLSTMAGYEPGLMIGTAPLASYMLLRTEDGSSEFPIEEDYWVAGAEYADSAGADIINSSLGYTTFQNEVYDHSYADMNGNTTRGAVGADIAASKGILVVNSAGNSGASAWQYIGTPADGDSVLAIGAVDPQGNIASFSSIGPSSDGDIKPNVCGQGQQAAVINSSGNVVTGNGTSFSGPIMAGMAACLWQSNPEMTNMEIFHSIEESAHLFSNPDHLYGYGIPNFAMANLILSGVVPRNIEEDELFDIHPNVFVDRIEGTFYSADKQDVTLRLLNGSGQEVKRIDGQVGATCAVFFSFEGLLGLNAGMYYVQALSANGKFSRKMVKVAP